MIVLGYPLNPYQRSFCRQTFLGLLEDVPQDPIDAVVLLLPHGKLVRMMKWRYIYRRTGNFER